MSMIETDSLNGDANEKESKHSEFIDNRADLGHSVNCGNILF